MLCPIRPCADRSYRPSPSCSRSCSASASPWPQDRPSRRGLRDSRKQMTNLDVPAPADPQLLRRSARHRDVRRRQLLRRARRSRSRPRRPYLADARPSTTATASRPSSSTSTTRRSRRGTTRSSATGRSTRRRTDVRDRAAVPGRPRHGRPGTDAQRPGYAVIFVTGRGAAQEAATLGNLTSDGVGVDAGYPVPTTLNDGEDGLFTKPAIADYPDYLEHRVRRRGLGRVVLLDDPLQVGDPRPHRIARLRHRGQLRRPVQRPQGRITRTGPSRCRTRTTSSPDDTTSRVHPEAAQVVRKSFRGGGGEGGIRTHEVFDSALFKSAAINRSATSPRSG